ncbi:hypothetical protein CWC05_18340 [Pseudoalteromonas ruthenica]|uniref:Mg chelatase-related protein C-terminal domain-containing protein n=1 Tax=Pseudoalteromonas ruthenica TaxID=151081 RepID=A0A5S3Z0V2_9GAMM|nr:hypothetical protein CWC05_18340 [Pseudoalteromonas ruthenica]
MNGTNSGERSHFIDVILFCRCRLFNSSVIVKRLQLSPRSHHRVIKVARTIADLNTMTNIQVEHIKEALSYRAFERLLARLGE